MNLGCDGTWLRRDVLMPLCMLPALSIAAPAMAEEAKAPTSPRGSLAALAWLVGSWRGEGFGGDVEEIWLPPSGSSMVGMFRGSRGGTPWLFELMQIAAAGDALTLRVKHFTADLVGWEEKDRFVEFPLKSKGDNRADFGAVAYALDNGRLTIRVQTAAQGQTSLNTLVLTRS